MKKRQKPNIIVVIAADTIVVFTSDHGDMLFSHNRGWKDKPWREAIDIPLLMRFGPATFPPNAARAVRGFSTTTSTIRSRWTI